MAPMSPVPAARAFSSRMRNFSPAVNVRRLGRFDNSGLAAAGAGTTVGLRPSSVPAPAAARASATLLGMTTRQFSYALKSKLLGACVSSSLARRGRIFRRTRTNPRSAPQRHDGPMVAVADPHHPSAFRTGTPERNQDLLVRRLHSAPGP